MKNINTLLRENKLSHFEFDEEKNRIVYNYEDSTFTRVEDYKRLIQLLKDNEIKHDDVGMDVIFIEED